MGIGFFKAILPRMDGCGGIARRMRAELAAHGLREDDALAWCRVMASASRGVCMAYFARRVFREVPGAVEDYEALPAAVQAYFEPCPTGYSLTPAGAQWIGKLSGRIAWEPMERKGGEG